MTSVSLSMLVIGLGGLLALAALLMVAGQVRVHRIDPSSWAARLLWAAALALAVGQWLAASARDPLLIVAALMGGLLLVAVSAATVDHEWRQAGERRDPGFRLPRNGPITALRVLQACVGLAALLLIGGLALGLLTSPLRTLVIVVAMANLAVLYALGSFIAPEWRASGFALGRSLSLRIFLAGMLVTLSGLLAWNQI
ncbi:MAG TPA: hypothetical protein VFS21_07325 [Roseiflexaceae bacterium]|nr:hypothetical protein [Roseiflexaceae bacterium]